MSKAKTSTIADRGTTISILTGKDGDFISLTDMLKVKDGEFFISDWLRNRNTAALQRGVRTGPSIVRTEPVINRYANRAANLQSFSGHGPERR